MNDATQAAAGAVSLDYDLPHSPQKVWRVLTEPALVARWLMPGDIAAVVGHRFTLTTEPAPAHGFDGIVHCQVTEVEPNRRLSYTWRGGPLDTMVTWTLTPTDTGTRLHLEQTGFGPYPQAAAGALYGWKKMVAGGALDAALAAIA